MNLAKLFEAQKKLDERIIKEKGLREQDLFYKKILAFSAELMECANEWRGFKFWSEDQEPRTNEPYHVYVLYKGQQIPDVKYKNSLLEEYVDCLHFALSLNLYVWNSNPGTVNVIPKVFDTIEEQFIEIGGEAYKLYENADVFMHSGLLLANVLGLGQALGFDDEQIEDAYFKKNALNHKRQEEHY